MILNETSQGGMNEEFITAEIVHRLTAEQLLQTTLRWTLSSWSWKLPNTSDSSRLQFSRRINWVCVILSPSFLSFKYQSYVRGWIGVMTLLCAFTSKPTNSIPVLSIIWTYLKLSMSWACGFSFMILWVPTTDTTCPTCPQTVYPACVPFKQFLTRDEFYSGYKKSLWAVLCLSISWIKPITKLLMIQ